MRVFLMILAGASLSMLGLGYWSGSGAVASSDDDRVGKSATSKSSELQRQASINPSWRVDLGDAIDAAKEPDEFRGLLREIWDSSPVGIDREEWMKAVIARWIDLRGVKGVEEFRYAHSLPDDDFRTWIMRNRDFAMQRLALIDFDAAFELSKSQGGASFPDWAPLLFERHPDRVGDMIRAGKFGGSEDQWQQAGRLLAGQGWENASILEEWHAKGIAHQSKYLESFFMGFASELAATDVERLLEWADKLDAKKLPRRPSLSRVPPSSTVRMTAIKALAATDIDKAKRLAAESDDYRVTNMMVGLLAESDLQTAVDWISEATDKNPSLSALRALGPAIARLPTIDAIRFLEDYLPQTSAYSGSWSRALTGKGGHADSLGRDAALALESWRRAFTGGYADSLGPDAAPALTLEVAALPKSPVRDSMLGNALRVWSQTDPEAALVRGLALIRAGNTPQIAQSLSLSLAQNPSLLMDFAGAIPEEDWPAFFGSATHDIAENAEAIASVVASGIDRSGSEVAVGTLVRRWANDGLRAPSTWLADLPDGDPKDAGIVALVGHLAEIEPNSALVWAQSAQSDSARMEAFQTTLRPWAAADPEGAANAVSGLEVSDAEREALLEIVLNPPDPSAPPRRP